MATERRTPEQLSSSSTLGPKRDGLGGNNAAHRSKATEAAATAGAYCARCGAWRGELGSEPTPEQFVANLVEVFREVRRVLHPSGTLWLNLGDSYANQGGHTVLGATSQRQGRSNIAAQHAVKGSIPQGYKPKDLMLMPHRVAMALQADGWWLRSAVVWAKKAPMPESVTDRPTSAYEMVFLLAKRERYYYDAEAVREPLADANAQRTTAHYDTAERYGAGNGGNGGLDALASRMRNGEHGGRNLRNFWLLSPESFSDAHFATFPTEIPRRAILAGTSERGCCPRCLAPWRRVTSTRIEGTPRNESGNYARHDGLDGTNSFLSKTAIHGTRISDTLGWASSCRCDAGEPIPCTVLDPFGGSGTTLLVADRLGRDAVGIELNPEYARMAEERIAQDAPMWSEVERREDATPLGLWEDAV